MIEVLLPTIVEQKVPYSDAGATPAVALIMTAGLAPPRHGHRLARAAIAGLAS